MCMKSMEIMKDKPRAHSCDVVRRCRFLFLITLTAMGNSVFLLKTRGVHVHHQCEFNHWQRQQKSIELKDSIAQ
jgi:hypothetical protein